MSDVWDLVKHGYERTPHSIKFNTATLPFGSKLEMLQEAPDGSEWVKLTGQLTIPAGVFIRVRMDPHAQNRAQRRAWRKEHKARGAAKAAIRKAQETANG